MSNGKTLNPRNCVDFSFNNVSNHLVTTHLKMSMGMSTIFFPLHLSEYNNGIMIKKHPDMLTIPNAALPGRKKTSIDSKTLMIYLEVKPNDKKAWRYRFILNGKSSMFAFGECPKVKRAKAREKCEQARKQVANGVSPMQTR